MLLRRSTTAVAIATGLLGGAGLLSAATFVSPDPAPLRVQSIGSVNGPGAAVGPCAEAKPPDAPRSAGSGITAAGATPASPAARVTDTTSPTGAAPTTTAPSTTVAADAGG